MRKNRSQYLRISLAREAARLMYEEGVSQYLPAKQLATKRILGKPGGKSTRYRPKNLPSNGEIKNFLLDLAKLHEGDDHTYRLFSMRVIALELMDELEPYIPRLIGSVSTGYVRKGSDIDLHLFTDSIESLLTYLDRVQRRYEVAEIAIQSSGKIKHYTHIYLHHIFPVELSIYPTLDIRVVPRSSTDGKAIVRLKADRVKQLLELEHKEEWIAYQSSGVLKHYRT